MTSLDSVFWIGVCSSLLSVVGLCTPTAVKNKIQAGLDHFTLWLSYYDIDWLYGHLRTTGGRLTLGGLTVAISWTSTFLALGRWHIRSLLNYPWAVPLVALQFLVIMSSIYFGAKWLFGTTGLKAATKRLSLVVVGYFVISFLLLYPFIDDERPMFHQGTWANIASGIYILLVIPSATAIYLLLYAAIIWLSMFLARTLSFIMWGVVGHREGALAGLLVLLTTLFGVLKLVVSK